MKEIIKQMPYRYIIYYFINNILNNKKASRNNKFLLAFYDGFYSNGFLDIVYIQSIDSFGLVMQGF